jgi:glycosyltransferase involved in cell wall biosynthesis
VHITFLHPAALFSDETERLLSSVRAAVAAGARVSVVVGDGARTSALAKAGGEIHFAELLTASLAESLRTPYILEVTAPPRASLPIQPTWNRAVVVPCGSFVESAVNRGQISRASLRVIEHGPPLQRTWTVRPFDHVDVPVIANLGTLDERHGTLILVEATRLLKDAGRTFRTIVLGEGPAEDAVRRRVRELDLTESFTVACPSFPDLAAVLFEIDVHVSCVSGGSPGWCAVQALGLGIPSIFSAVSCSFPLVEDRRNGLLVERNSPDQLAEALSMMLDNRAAAMGMGRMARQGLRAGEIGDKYAGEVVEVQEMACGGVAAG